VAFIFEAEPVRSHTSFGLEEDVESQEEEREGKASSSNLYILYL
jgi:hypothetical protein